MYEKKPSFFLALLSCTLLYSCQKSPSADSLARAEDLSLQASLRQAVFTDQQALSLLEGSETIRVNVGPIALRFFGWGMDKDKIIPVNFPSKKEGPFKRVLLRYVMGCADGGCSDWDNTTIIKLQIGTEFFEIARAFTPYGGLFTSDF